MGLQHIGHQSQLYVKKDSSYAAIPSLAATDFLRHRAGLVLSDNPFSRVHTEEKKISAGYFSGSRRDRKHVASFSGLNVELRPSGTLNTVPEISVLLENAFGSVRNVTLATTVGAGTGAVGGATLASATGLAKWDAVLITCPDGKLRLRFLTAVDTGTGVVTWAPNLPTGQEPADGAAVKGCITYRLTTAMALSFAIARFTRKTDQTAGIGELGLGAAIAEMQLMLDAADPVLTFSGPMAQMLDPTDGSFATQPASDTQVGPATSPHGMSGELVVGGIAQKFLKLGLTLSTNVKLRNEEADQSVASEVYRAGYYDISVALDTRASKDDAATLYNKAFAGTKVDVFRQQGPFTEGDNFAVYLPSVDVPPPDTDMPMSEANWPFKGVAGESVENENNGLILAIG